MMHESNRKVCECLGITKEEAITLIATIRDDWAKLVSGIDGSAFTVCSIYSKINTSDLRGNEKCFLCTHVAQSWEIYNLRELVRSGNTEGFLKEIGMW